MELCLVNPAVERLPGFIDALQRGWSHDNLRGAAAARELLELIDRDPSAFFAAADDPEGRAGDVALPDGSKARRLPGLYRWLWDGEFCGLIGLRWAKGTAELPPHVLGHIGYSVVPWKRGRGYATRALGQILPLARAQGLAYVELTTDENNLPSQRTILANGGRLIRVRQAASLWRRTVAEVSHRPRLRGVVTALEWKA